ncbi:MAG: hypothetical protein IH978_04605, partial [Nitrospinae bacterium]|nr:hypothetical protein [Nitrospinota bacterium]
NTTIFQIFLKIKEENGKVRIYRDARIKGCCFLILIFSLFIFIFNFIFTDPHLRLTHDEKWIITFMLVVFAIMVGLSLLWNHHGSITLDDKRGVLEFSNNWDLNIPSFTVWRKNIDRIEVGAAMSGHDLTLCRQRRPEHYEKKELKLRFVTFFPEFGFRKDLIRAAQLIGEFANKPAFDWDGKQIFTPKK